MNVGRPRTGEPKSRITLVPFAGISLIRFRGSRINGLSRCSVKHSALRQEDFLHPSRPSGVSCLYSPESLT
ncbi:hypothetical protein EDF88_4896 [Buttiauxella sp. BIGb0552]|nr:hypothetical protein EDF88_4896 [Buttiauxella sp. BIGb0552]